MVDFGAADFIVRVRDDGRGMAPDAERPGHWGLAGMRERAAAIGAHLAITPGPGGSGTAVELRVPAAHAYADAPRRRWWQRPLLDPTLS
jgi:signal transduction histidine kinase